ncbi:MAG: hypothetical protein M5U33_13905 [Pseudorhodoplanes sp.]|nr:hypothetical protein [Pseudorhodoplanes sp.]
MRDEKKSRRASRRLLRVPACERTITGVWSRIGFWRRALLALVVVLGRAQHDLAHAVAVGDRQRLQDDVVAI